jgi:hypothetical protein
MKILLLFLFVFVAALYSSAQTDLFFSEYIEGSGNNKAVEIYNPTSQTIDLSKYSVARYSNGSAVYTEGGITQLVGSIAPYKTFVLVNGQTTLIGTSPAASPILQSMGNQQDHAYPAPTYMNGNDAIALLKLVGTTLTPVDLIGQIGLGATISAETGWANVKDTTVTYKNATNDVITGKVINYIVQELSATVNGAPSTAQFGPFWFAWTANHTLIRKPTVIKGVVSNPNPFIVTKEWDTLTAVIGADGKLTYTDIWTELGKHRCIADPDFYLSLNKTPAGSSAINVFPNPVVSDHFSLSSQQPVVEVEIFSVIGQSVYKQSYAKGLQQIEIGSLNLEKGMYLVKARYANKSTSVKKIMVK